MTSCTRLSLSHLATSELNTRVPHKLKSMRLFFTYLYLQNCGSIISEIFASKLLKFVTVCFVVFHYSSKDAPLSLNSVINFVLETEHVDNMQKQVPHKAWPNSRYQFHFLNYAVDMNPLGSTTSTTLTRGNPVQNEAIQRQNQTSTAPR